MFIKVKNKKATTSSTKSTNIRGTKIYDLLATNTQNLKQFHQKEWGKSYQIDIVNHSVLISIKNNSDMPQKNCPIGHPLHICWGNQDVNHALQTLKSTLKTRTAKKSHWNQPTSVIFWWHECKLKHWQEKREWSIQSTRYSTSECNVFDIDNFYVVAQ